MKRIILSLVATLLPALAHAADNPPLPNLPPAKAANTVRGR